MPQVALGQLKHLKTARARWSFPDVPALLLLPLDGDMAQVVVDVAVFGAPAAVVTWQLCASIWVVTWQGMGIIGGG